MLLKILQFYKPTVQDIQSLIGEAKQVLRPKLKKIDTTMTKL